MDLTLERMIPQLETSDLPESYFLMLHSTCVTWYMDMMSTVVVCILLY